MYEKMYLYKRITWWKTICNDLRDNYDKKSYLTNETNIDSKLLGDPQGMG